MEFATLALLAVSIGLVASMIGVGGGVFMVPLLALVYVPTTQIAVGTSLAAIVFNSLSSTIGYGRQGVVDFRLGGLLIPTALAGAWLGAYLTASVSSQGLAIAFGLVLVYVAALMLWGRSPKELAAKFQKQTSEGQTVYRPLPVMGVGFVAGVASGFFGIGGGIVMVPAITLLLGAGVLTAVATSLFVMGPSALVGAGQHLLQGNLAWELALPLAVGIVIGAGIGSQIATRVPQLLLRRLFGLVLLYAAANMIWNGLQ